MTRSNIPPHIAKFICSQQTEDSETKEQIISLGEALVKELDPEPGTDTLSRWLAHYVAEQIVTAENATGDEASEAERRCFEAILNLWHHRSSFSKGHRPFENFEPIFRALSRIDPECRQSYYFEDFIHQKETDKTPDAKTNKVQSWVNIALAVDRAARVLLDFVFKQAAHHAADVKTKSWIKNAAKLSGNDDDLSVVIRLLPAMQDNQEKDNLERIRQNQLENLRSKIEKLDAFLTCSKSIRKSLSREIRQLSKKKGRIRKRRRRSS